MDFKVLVLQTDIVWENIEANLSNVERLISSTTDEFNVILLPEMFSTGFSSNAQALAEPISGRTIQKVKEWAARYDSLVIGSYIAEDGGLYYNRGFAIEPDGTAHYYDKCHLFIGWEKQFFTPGDKRLVFNYRGWNVSLCICYDLRFPVWTRNRNLEYDVLFCTTQWPVSRQNVLETLIAARAIENQAYAVASNRIGTDGNYIKYVGGSQAVDFRGRIVGRCTDSTEEAKVITLNKYALESNREKAPVWKDAEMFTLDK
ncbi:MAG: nitrilase family protein [Paludibacteraceae bacterium]|nr:nitrilase family protein [Paludibacteraceae bacterium]